MPLIDRKNKVIHCKIVYYGPGMAGKTSNLQSIYWQLPEADRSQLLSIATETERTLFFDLAHPTLRELRSLTIRWHLYTVPGCVLYQRSRLAVLHGASGVVFVASSEKSRLLENLKSLRDLALGLTAQEKPLHLFPIVLQYNKRDIPDPLAVERMDQHLNLLPWQRIEASAAEGDGVMETLNAICGLVYAGLNQPAAPPSEPPEPLRPLLASLREEAGQWQKRMQREMGPVSDSAVDTTPATSRFGRMFQWLRKR
jgi:signal recognition particle receptor subunit beta